MRRLFQKIERPVSVVLKPMPHGEYSWNRMDEAPEIIIGSVLVQLGRHRGFEGVGHVWETRRKLRLYAIRQPVQTLQKPPRGQTRDGFGLKMRGIETRRHDTPLFIEKTQMKMLERLAQVEDADLLPNVLPELVVMLQRRLSALRRGKVPLEHLLVTQRLSRTLDEYRTPSPAARAASQLLETGRELRPGQRVQFVYTRGKPGVHAWDLPDAPNPRTLDIERYTTLMLRSAHAVLQPFGVSEPMLHDWVIRNASYSAPPGVLPLPSRHNLPLWTVPASG